LVLDDIDGLAMSPDFANWLKSLVDEIATSVQPLPLCLVLVGLEERRQELIQLQPSLARIFNLIEIKAWSKEETETFFREAFSKVGITVDDDALEQWLIRFAGGLPVLAHEVGDAAFDADSDGRIDKSDALKGVLDAAEVVGRKHLQPQIMAAIRSARYRSILRKLAKEPLELNFHRREVLEILSGDEIRVFDNFVRRMVQLGVVKRDQERGRGAYSFANLLYHTYFWMEAERARSSKAAS
jgi:RNAse (barnase) inhibitor barstar